MTGLDERTVAELWRTSSAEVRERYLREEQLGRPAYDRLPSASPRAYVVRCENPYCDAVVVVVHQRGTRRRFCSEACTQMARYWADPKRFRAAAAVHRARRRARKAAAA